MLSQKLKHSISYVFLLTFLFIKVAGLHALTHKDHLNDTKDCIWCHLSGTDTNTPILSAEESFEIVNPTVPHYAEIPIHYTHLPSQKMPVCAINNKPPPFTV